MKLALRRLEDLALVAADLDHAPTAVVAVAVDESAFPTKIIGSLRASLASLAGNT
jgi:hypothetical protein